MTLVQAPAGNLRHPLTLPPTPNQAFGLGRHSLGHRVRATIRAKPNKRHRQSMDLAAARRLLRVQLQVWPGFRLPSGFGAGSSRLPLLPILRRGRAAWTTSTSRVHGRTIIAAGVMVSTAETGRLADRTTTGAAAPMDGTGLTPADLPLPRAHRVLPRPDHQPKSALAALQPARSPVVCRLTC